MKTVWMWPVCRLVPRGTVSFGSLAGRPRPRESGLDSAPASTAAAVVRQLSVAGGADRSRLDAEAVASLNGRRRRARIGRRS